MSAGIPKGVKKLRSGLYRIVGARCLCGGTMKAERWGRHWVLSCPRCRFGSQAHNTLRECIEAAGPLADDEGVTWLPAIRCIDRNNPRLVLTIIRQEIKP